MLQLAYRGLCFIHTGSSSGIAEEGPVAKKRKTEDSGDKVCGLVNCSFTRSILLLCILTIAS